MTGKLIKRKWFRHRKEKKQVERERLREQYEQMQHDGREHVEQGREMLQKSVEQGKELIGQNREKFEQDVKDLQEGVRGFQEDAREWHEEAKKSHWKRLVSARFMYISALAFAVAAGVLGYSGCLEKVDQLVSDRVYQMISTAENTSKIKIISIDDKTVEAYGEYENWSRSRTEKLLKQLNKTTASQPAAIGIDLDYSQTKDTTADESLAKLCSKYENICLGVSAVMDDKKLEQKKETGTALPAPTGTALPKPTGTPVSQTADALPSIQPGSRQGGDIPQERNNMMADQQISDVKMPYDALASEVKTGIVNTTRNSPDGAVRNAVAKVMVDGTEMDSFAVALYKLYQDSKGEEYSLPKLDDEQSFGFTYAKKSTDYTVYSFYDVVNGKVPDNTFRDCVVLVGDYTQKDTTLKVPNQSNQQMQEVEVQANMLQALLENRTGQPVSKVFTAIFYAVFIGLFFIATSYSSGSRTVVIAVLLDVLQLGSCVMLSRWGYFVNILVPILMVIVVAVYNLSVRYVVAVQNRSAMENVFKKYVDESVVDELGKDGLIEAHIGVTRKDIAVMFVDIRGFTALSESLSPEQIVEILNEYLTLVADAVSNHHGTLDKFIGDAAMAVFNSPIDQEDYEYQSVCAAWELLSNADALNRKCQKEYGKNVSFGIGIQCGEAVIGNIGCESRMDYTAIGDTVNTASRLEGVAAPGQILISEEMNRRLGERIQTTFAGEYELKGKAHKVPAYMVQGVGSVPKDTVGL